ncbi:MAG: hypothetical protein MI923_09650 [Phycisphaerales bacterium]|nr:hypothetical protein [Phycisphaerales bacterium]
MSSKRTTARDSSHDENYKPAKTLDGSVVKVMAKINDREDVLVASVNGADGIGLYRMERAYRSCETPAMERELVRSMRSTFSLFEGLPITVCLWDGVGSERPPVGPVGLEASMGGIKRLMECSDFTRTQLRALLQMAVEHDIRILVPTITLSEELEWVRAMLEEVSEDVGVDILPPLGDLVESPHAARGADEFGRCADFLSVCVSGSNQVREEECRIRDTHRNRGSAPNDAAILRVVQTAVDKERSTCVPIEVCDKLGHV